MAKSDVNPLPSDDFAREARRLHGLARALLFDHHGGEDVVQEAWLAALSNPPSRRSASLGQWLAATVRNLARQRNREEARRERRERSAARAERVEGPDEVGARLELLRRMFDALDELDEPYRSAVALRFLDGLPPREISKRIGVPVNTVRTHVRRGLEQLRQKLDGDGRGREQLLGALVPLAGKPPLGWLLLGPAGSTSSATPAPWIGALFMSNKLLVAGVAAVLLAFTAWLARPGTEGPELSPDPDRAGAEAPVQPSGAAPELASEQPPPSEPSIRSEPERVAVAEAPGTWVVRGQAVNEDGTPHPGLAITVRLHGGYDEEAPLVREGQTFSDSQGRFSWTTPRPERSVLVAPRAEAQNLWISSTDALVLAGEEAPTELLLRIRPLDVEVRGRVLAESGEPIAGAEVEALGRTTETDAQGRYLLHTTSTRRTTRLRARAEGFAPATSNVTPLGPGPLTAGDIELTVERVVRGRVVDEGGAPVRGATLAPGIFDPVEAETDQDGRFALGSVDPSDERLHLYVDAPGFAQTVFHTPLAELPEELVLTLVRAASLTGRVVDTLGQPVEAALVCVGNPPDTYPHEQGWSGVDGSFTVGRLRPGRHPVWVARAGYAPFETVVEVTRDGPSPTWLEVTLVGGHRIGGVVIDDRGEPVAQALIYFELADRGAGDDVSLSTRTDAQGRFTQEELRDARYRIGILHEGFARLESDAVRLGALDHSFSLRRSGLLGGRVVDGRTGEPVRAFEVRLVDPLLEEGDEQLWGYSSAWSVGMPFVDTDGYFRLNNGNLEAGRAIGIEARAEGYATALAPRVITAPELDPDALVLRLYPGATVRGRVVERDSGRPVPGARVLRLTERVPLAQAASPWTEVLETETDESGAFELIDVPQGAMSLGVLHDDWATRIDGPFEVPTGAPLLRPDIRLSSGASIAVRVLTPDGYPMTEAGVALFPRQDRDDHDRSQRSALTDPDGSALFEHLAPGEYQVSWTKSAGNSTLNLLSQDVQVGPDERVEVELRPHGRSTVTGTVSLADGSPIPNNLWVSLVAQEDPASDEELPPLRAEFAQQGRFTIEYVPAGHYQLFCQWHPGQPDSGYWSGEVELEVESEDWVETHLELQHH